MHAIFDESGGPDEEKTRDDVELEKILQYQSNSISKEGVEEDKSDANVADTQGPVHLKLLKQR